jgi:hypothetical protein
MPASATLKLGTAAQLGGHVRLEPRHEPPQPRVNLRGKKS